MELHRPLGKHEARFGSLASVPSLLSTDVPYSPHPYGSPSFSLHHTTQSVIPSYGTASGVQLLYNSPPEEPHSRKRRKIDPNISMSQSDSSSDRGDSENISILYSHDYRGHAQNSSVLRCVDHTMSSSHYGSSIARGVASLGQMLCPCCGFDWRRTGGHHYVPEPPPNAMYDPKTPYMVEKPPLMQPSISPVDSVGLGMGRHLEGLGYNESPSQPNFTTAEFPTVTESHGTSTHGRNSISYESCPIGLVKSESHTSIQDILSPKSVQGGDQLSAQEPNIIGISSPPSIQSPDGGVAYGFLAGQMMITRCEPLDMSPLEAWSTAPLPEQQPSFDFLLPNQRGGKRGPFKDLIAREQTAQTRKIGSCIRCRMQRIRCESNSDDPGADCLTCDRVTKSKAGRFPCLRYKITDIRMYKPGPVPGYEWTRRWNNNISDPIQRWASSEIKVIRLSEGYSKQSIELRVRKFVPQEGDKLERTWDHHGTKRSVAIPPFALVDLEEGRKAYTKYIRDSMVDTFPRILGPKDGLLYKTYLQAWRLCRSSSASMEALQLLNWTFRLWMSIRLSTTSIFIVGEETLGMSRDILDETSPNHGKIPVPPVLGAQTDLILIHHVQTKLRREVLDKLQKITLKNKQDTWLLTYLVTFMLLHNAAMIMAHDARYARKHGIKRRFARKDEVAEYFLGANILLAHFHYCNKGLYPFSDECKDKDLRTLADLDDETIQFVHATREYATRHKVEWEEIQRRGAYEHDYFFISQLFEEGWQPRSMA